MKRFLPNWIKKWLANREAKRKYNQYKALRQDIVDCLRTTDVGWTTINKVLYAIGQKQVISVHKLRDGREHIKFQYAPKVITPTFSREIDTNKNISKLN